MERGRKAGPAALVLLALALSSCAVSPARHDLAVEWYGVGNAWLAAGKYAEAGKAYDRSLALDPSLAAASYNAARALVEAGSYDRALAVADGLIKAEPDNLRFLGLRAYALYKAGRMKEAADAYEGAYSLDAWAPDIVYNSSLLLVEAGEPAKDIERLAPLVKAKPDDAVLLSLNARALADAGRDAEAIAAWEDLRSAGTIDTPSLERLGALLEKTGEYARAIEALAALVEKDPKRGAAWFALARLRLTRADDGPGGLAALGEALKAGFADKDAVASLLAEPHLVEREAVAKALGDKGLGPDAAPTADGPGADASGTAPAAPDAGQDDAANQAAPTGGSATP